MRRVFASLLLVFAVHAAHASVARTSLEKLARITPTIVVVKIEKVTVDDERRWAEARVEDLLKGPPLETVRFLASGTWTCDTSGGKEGEEALLFLDPASAGRLGVDPSTLPADAFLIAWSGRGRMTIRDIGGEKYADFPDDVALPTGVASLRSDQSREYHDAVPLTAVIQWLVASGYTKPQEPLPSSCTGLITAVGREDRRHEAIAELTNRGADCATELVEALADVNINKETRTQIGARLCHMKERPPSVAQRIGELATQSNNATTRRSATILLSCLPDDQAIPALREALGSSDEEVRRAAVRGIFGPARVRALLPLLLEHIETDTSPEVRCWATERLEALEDDAIEHLPFLRRAASDKDDYVRNCIVETIGIIEKKHRK